MKRAALILVALAALAAGVAGGLTYTWVLAPAEYSDTTPDSLYIQDKLVYATLIGDLYVCEQDLTQAESRLAELDLEASGPELTGLIELYLDSGGRPEEARNLAQLARDVGASGGVLLVFGSPATPTPVDSPTPPPGSPQTRQAEVTASPFPTLTPVPEFRLTERTALCAAAGAPGQIAVLVQDARGKGLPGVEVVVSWSSGQDRFYTGLRPERGAGYADFEMSPGVEYSVGLSGSAGDIAEGLTSKVQPGACPTQTLAVDWRLIFEQVP